LPRSDACMVTIAQGTTVVNVSFGQTSEQPVDFGC
jgi:hypothetical protein